MCFHFGDALSMSIFKCSRREFRAAASLYATDLYARHGIERDYGRLLGASFIRHFRRDITAFSAF